MPIYEYRCSQCGHELEALQKISDPALTECPACHRSTLAKAVTAAGFQLKGSGWYATDFRNGGKPAAKPAANGGAAPDAKPAGGSKGDGGGDAKPASEAKPAGCGSSCACH